MNRIYLDHAATSPLASSVLEEMMPYFAEHFGNASSIYDTGRDARKAVEAARKRVATVLNCQPQEVYFTSGGTESDNWAIKGAAFANQNKGRHIISSQIEHHAVLHTLAWLEGQGFEVTYLPVDAMGRVSPDDVQNAIREDTILITIMAANNEIGTIQPMTEIGQIAKERKVLFHTDAVQAVGAIKTDVEEWQVDLLSLSAHKFQGPKGVGVLYVRKGTKMEPLMHGGAQERGRRAGTENLAGIVGLGAAIKRADEAREKNAQTISRLRDDLIKGILTGIPHTRLNGDPKNRLPNNVNISIEYIEGEAILLRLDFLGIAASSGSACTSGSLDPSHVLLAIGLPHEIAHGSLRMTLSSDTTQSEVDEVIAALKKIVKELREMSPLFA